MSQLATSCYILFLLALTTTVRGQIGVEMRVPVEGQPLSANVTRVLQALQFLGAPLRRDVIKELEARRTGPGRGSPPGITRSSRPFRRHDQSRIPREGAARSSPSPVAAGRVYPCAREDHQPKHCDQGTPHREPTVRPGLCRHVAVERRSACSEHISRKPWKRAWLRGDFWNWRCIRGLR